MHVQMHLFRKFTCVKYKKKKKYTFNKTFTALCTGEINKVEMMYSALQLPKPVSSVDDIKSTIVIETARAVSVANVAVRYCKLCCTIMGMQACGMDLMPITGDNHIQYRSYTMRTIAQGYFYHELYFSCNMRYVLNYLFIFIIADQRSWQHSYHQRTPTKCYMYS